MSKEDQRKYVKDMSITITGSNCVTEYPLYVPGSDTRDEINCVDSYEMYCGPAQPFPYIEMSLKKQRLQTYYPALLEDMKAGRNIIYVDAVGRDTFILTKVKTSGRNITITGYSPYEVLKSVKFSSAEQYYYNCDSNKNMSGDATVSYVKNPVALIVYCLTSNLSSISGISLGIKTSNIIISPGFLRCLENEDDAKLMWVSKVLINKEWGDEPESGKLTLTIDSSLTIWQVITICAITIGAKVYFMEDRAYIIDDNDEALPQPYNLWEESGQINTTSGEPWIVEDHQYLTMKDRRPKDPTDEQLEFTSRIIDTPELGNEGVETVYNSVMVSANIIDGTTAYGYTTIENETVIDYADQWCADRPIYGPYRTYPTITGTGSTVDLTVQGSRNFFGTCTKTIDLPCKCTWSPDTEEEVEKRNGYLNNPLTHLISAKQMVHLADAEQSIGFKMTEMGKTFESEKIEHCYWEPYYWMTLKYSDTNIYEIGPLARASGFTDFVNETRITNKQNFGDSRELSGKLTLSKIVRNFPGMYSEYWFGIIEVCDLTAELSKILYKTV